MSKRMPVPESERHIVAIGGGMTTNFVIAYVLKLANKPRPNLLFINTASGDSTRLLASSYKSVASLECTASHLPFFDRTPPDLEDLIFSQDVVFVSGGNTMSMLGVWREYELDKILRQAWEGGVILSGSSAGGMCWFEGCCADSYAQKFIALNALGFLKGSCCPHYNQEGRSDGYHALIERGKLGNGYAIDEEVGLHFIGEELQRVVTPKQQSKAYRVELKDGKAQAEAIPAQLLPRGAYISLHDPFADP